MRNKIKIRGTVTNQQRNYNTKVKIPRIEQKDQESIQKNILHQLLRFVHK